MKPKFKFSFPSGRHLFGRVICAGVVLLFASSAQAQNLFVANSSGDLDISGKGDGYIYEFTSEGARSTFASGLDDPSGLAFNSAGNLYVANASFASGGGGYITEITPSGTQNTFASGLNHPGALAFDSAGNLFAVDSGNIYEFTLDGSESIFVSGLSANALAFDRAGNLFATDNLGGNIYKFTPEGTESTFASGLNNLNGLAFNNLGNLFVPNAFLSFGVATITEITPSGTQSVFASGFNNFGALAFDNADNLFAVDFFRRNIYEFTPDGTESTFASGLLYPPFALAFQPTPEPSVLVLLAVGAFAFFAARRLCTIPWSSLAR